MSKYYFYIGDNDNREPIGEIVVDNVTSYEQAKSLAEAQQLPEGQYIESWEKGPEGAHEQTLWNDNYPHHRY